MSVVLQTTNLVIGYSGVVLQEPLDIVINKGEFVSITGKNGVGKSTFLRTVSGLHEPVSGGVEFRGRDIKKYKINELARIVSIVFANSIFASGLKVYDLLVLARYPYTSFWKDISNIDIKKIEEIIDLFGLKALQNKKLGNLSDGQRQKVFIAYVLCKDTPLILLDEPTAFLDIETKEEVFEVLKEQVLNNDRTVVFSSHDRDIINRYASSVIEFI